MNILSDQLVLWAINVLIHTTLLTALLLLIATLFRTRAAMRYWVLCCGLLLVLISPAISAAIQSRGNGWLALAVPSDTATPHFETSALKAMSERLAERKPIPSSMLPLAADLALEPINDRAATTDISGPPTAGVPVALEAVELESATEEVGRSRVVMDWLGTGVATVSLIWAVGATLLLLRMTVGWMRLSRILDRAEPVEDAGFQAAFSRACAAVGCDERRTPRLVASDEVSGPLAAGLFGGSIVLPKQLIAQANPAELAEVLIHEVAHVVRRDQVVVLVQNLVAAVYWPHPLVRKLNRELAKAREEVCDNFVLATTDAPVYSRTLLSLAQLVQRIETLPGSVGFFASRWKLEQRVAGLLDEARDRTTFLSLRGWVFVVAAMLTLLTAISLGTITIATAQNADQEASSEAVSSLAVVIDNATADDQASNQEGQAPLKPAATEDVPVTGGNKSVSEKRLEKDEEPIPLKDQPVQLLYRCKVLDQETGRGVPNATVTVDRVDSKGGHWPYKSIAKTTHISDAQGEFTVEIPPEQSGYPWLYIQVYVEHDDYVRIPGIGYSFDMIRKNETTGERPFFESLRLQPADRVTGTVVSPAGKPLAEVKVFGFTAPQERKPNSVRWLETSTAADGTFSLNAMKGGVAFFWVMPNDYSIVQKSVSNQPGDLGEIRVPAGIRISGRVVSAEDQPLAGIALNAYREGRDESSRAYSVLSGIRRGTLTDAEGRFTFDPLPPGEYRVVPEEELSDPRRERDLHPLLGVFIAQTTTLQEGEIPPELKFQAVPHINFHAQYVDSQGAKRSGHEFSISGQWDDGFWSTRARPDLEGTATVLLPRGLRNVSVGLITNEHSALRHRKSGGRPIENQVHDVQLGTLNDDVEGFEIIRYKAPIALIQAVDSEGRPVRHFRVTAKYAFGDQRYILDGDLRSDVSFEHQNDGRYRTSQMLPDEEVTFTAFAVGYEPASEKLKLAEGETKDVVITLKSVSVVVDAINSAVDGTVQMIQNLNPNARAKQE